MKFILLMLVASYAWAQVPYVPPTKLLKKKGYQLGVAVDSWTTSKLSDDKGEKVGLQDGEGFSRIQAEAAGYYGATSNLQFGLGFRYRQNRSTFTNANEEITATGTGLESTFASIKYAFAPVDKLQYALEGLFRFRPFSNEEIPATSTVDDFKVLSLGDEGNEISGGLGLTYNGPEKSFFTLRGGYRKAGTHISDELYWQFEAAKSWQSVAFIVGVDGISSISNDPYGNEQSKRPNFWYGSTNLYNRENRDLVAPYGGLNFALGKAWRVELKGSQTIAGTSTDLGTAFAFSLIRRVDISETRLIDSKFKTYDIEASVVKVSPQENYVVIDKGLGDDVQKGMKFDFFEFDYVGGNVLIATGTVFQVKAETSIVKITQKFRSGSKLKDGLIGRASVK